MLEKIRNYINYLDQVCVCLSLFIHVCFIFTISLFLLFIFIYFIFPQKLEFVRTYKKPLCSDANLGWKIDKKAELRKETQDVKQINIKQT